MIEDVILTSPLINEKVILASPLIIEKVILASPLVISKIFFTSYPDFCMLQFTFLRGENLQWWLAQPLNISMLKTFNQLNVGEKCENDKLLRGCLHTIKSCLKLLTYKWHPKIYLPIL